MSLTPEQRTPPESAKNNAKKALRWREKYPDETRGAGTQVGWTRARQLANGGPLSIETIKRMASFNRHRANSNIDPKFKDEPWRDKGYLMWLAWGGTSGIDWAIKISEQYDNNKGHYNMEIKRITVPFSIKQMDEEDNDFYKFEGYGSTFGNVDLGQDRVMPGAFKACISEFIRSGKQLPVLWQHDMTMPLGTYVEMREDEKGLYVKGKMPKADDFVRGRVFPQMKAGSVSALSIGYAANQWDIDGDIRNLKELTLFEISLVTMPMNPQATISGVKGATSFQDLPLADVSRPWSATESRGRVRQFLDSVDEPSSRYRRAFLWFDSADAENFEAYKLPFADVVDGKLVAVPRAIFAAAAAMRGARGGVDIHESDKAKVESHINRYYEKMGRESPLKEKCLIIDAIDVKFLTERELECMLSLKSVKFSTQASKALISCLNVDTLRDAGSDNARDAKKDGEQKELSDVFKTLKSL